MGANFGLRKKEMLYDQIDNDLPLSERLNIAQQRNNLSNQYLKGSSAHKYAGLDTYQGKPSIFKGAYMTDLFKFQMDERGTWEGTGISTTDTTDLRDMIKQQPELLQVNLEGLKYELHQVAGTPERFILVLLGSFLERHHAQIQQAFPEAAILNLTHYTYAQATEKWTSAGG